ncbi:MAG: RIP metalloprotease RseP [Pseudomonadota bacterium]
MDILFDFFGQNGLFLQSFIIKALGFIFVLTIVVFFHELGHFLVARWCGVDVEAFSIGFGHEIVGFYDHKGTRWKLCWIPLGGYVKFIDDKNAASVPDHKDPDEAKAEFGEGAFQAKSVGQRSAIVAAGPIASFLLGIVIFTGIFSVYGYKYVKPIVGEVIPNSAAAEAGFKEKDLIISINGNNIESFADVRTIVQLSFNEPLNFAINRNGEVIALISTPRESETRDLLGNKQKLLGIKSSAEEGTFVSKEVGIFEATGLALDRTYQVISTSLEFLSRLFIGQASVNQLSGPIGIADASGKMAELGIVPLIQWIAFLSIAIGFFNLFPIPLLDGGHLLFYAVEAVMGKPLSESVQDVGFRIGMAILLSLMVFVTIIDVSRFFES